MQAFRDSSWRPAAVAHRRARTQRGSALLVVLVFAAIVAIMLYRELPIAAFEAQRQKEELLISRGNEYKRAVKLFVRKAGRFPNSIDELESTNRMRFLRHRYVDPFTGKDDWRLLHAGPGGVIVDSQVKSATDNKNSNALGQGATFGGFNNSFSGDTAAAAAAAADAVPSAGMRLRPAATQNAGALTNDPLAVAAGTAEAAPDGTASDGGVTAGATGQGAPAQTSMMNNSAATAPNGNAQNALDPVTGRPFANNINAQPGSPIPAGAGVPVAAGAGISTIGQQLNNVNPQMPQQAGGIGSSSAFGNSNITGNAGNGLIGAAGGIAGVASKAEGKGIKSVNDQTKYKLWEFYYDLKKDQSSGMAGALGGQQTQPNQNGNGATNNGANVLGGVGPGSSSGFGQGSSTTQSQGGGFGGFNQQPSAPQQAQAQQQ